MKNDLSVEEILSSVNDADWRSLEQQIASDLQDVIVSDPKNRAMDRLEKNYSKYFDLETWIRYHLRHARLMDLHSSNRPRRILDVGCGSGIFLHVCKALGHAGVGIDVNSDMYQRMAEILGVEYVPGLVVPFEPLDERFRGFDWITAIAIKFDRRDFANRDATPWALEEWKFFLRDCAQRLNEGGKLYIKPNFFKLNTLFEDPAITRLLENVASVQTPTGEFIIPREAVL